MVTKLVCRILSGMILGAVLAGATCGGRLAEAGPRQQEDVTVLVYGQTVDGRLDAGKPSLFYAFDAQAGDVVTIAMIITEGNLDPFLVLNDSAQTPLATDDNSGGGVNARLTYAIPAAGRYLIQATTAGGVVSEGGGAFSLNLTAAVAGEQPPAGSIATETASPPAEAPAAQDDSTRLVALQPGSPVRDTLDRQTAFRLYWFEAQAGDQITVTPEQLADFQPLIVLYDADFVEQQRAAPGVGLQLTVARGGVFFLAVSLPDSSAAGGGYGFSFEQSSVPAVPANYTDITYGQSQQGNIDSSVPVVTYRFRGSQGDTITVTMSRVGGDLNSYLYLLDGTGQTLYEDNDSGGDNGDARIVYTLPAAGEYLVIASRLGQAGGTTTGSYLLDLTADAPPPVEAEPTETVLPEDYQGLPQMAYGQTVEGELSDSKYLDVYVFQGSEADPVTIEMDSLNGDEPNGLDPFLVLLDDGRIPLLENDDIVDGQIRNSRIEFTLPRTGYYAIVATRFDQDQGTSAGGYTLTLNGPGTAVETAQALPSTGEAVLERLAPISLEPNTPAQGTFNAVAELYAFAGGAGASVDLSATTDPGLDAIVILADDMLEEVVSSGTGALTGVGLPKSGRYLVILAPRFGPVNALGGGYTLALTEVGESAAVVEPATGSQLISYGETVSGAVDDAVSSHLYTFSGRAGEMIRIRMEATPDSSLDSYLELQDASGTVLDANDDINPGVVRDSEIKASLPADGEYTILASRYVGEDAEITSGEYRLSLDLVDQNAVGTGAVPATIPIAYGQTLVGEINDEQYLTFFVFDGSAGDVITITIDHLNGNLDSVLYLYQAAGTGWAELASNDDSPTGGTYEPLLSGVTLPQTGKYLIVVTRYGLESESYFGTFAVTLTRES